MSTVKVQGNASGTGSITLASPNTNNNQTQTLPDVTGTSLVIDSSGNINNTSGVVNFGSGQVYKDSSGNVGIGTSSPSYKLDVVGTGRINNASGVTLTLDKPSGSSLQLNYNGNASSQLSGTSSGGLLFYTANGAGGALSQAMTLDSSGNLLVARTTDSDLIVGTTISNAGWIRATQTSTKSVFTLLNSTGTLIEFRYATTSANAVGSISTNGSTTAYNTTSDYRLKENVQPMTGALAKVSQLKPVTYTWKATGEPSQGFIAHELQAVVPDCVTGEKDAVETYIDEEGNEQTRPVYQGIDTSFLVATLTAAIQEQQAMIEELKAKVAALEAK